MEAKSLTTSGVYECFVRRSFQLDASLAHKPVSEFLIKNLN